MPKTKTLVNVRNRFIGGYADILLHIRESLLTAGIRRIPVEYNDAFPCYNVSLSGETDRVNVLLLDEDDRLIAVGESGTEYPLGEDLDGQDNYVLSYPLGLLDAVLESLKRLSGSLIRIPCHATPETLREALREWMSENNAIVLPEGYRPVIRSNETAVNVGFLFITCLLPDGNKFSHPIESVGAADLRRVAEAVNKYTILRITGIL